MTAGLAPAPADAALAQPIDPAPAIGPGRASLRWCALLAAIVLFEAALLHNAAARDVAPFVPLRFDQAAYLTETYTAYERVREQGLIRGLVATVREPRAQGWLIQPQAAALYVLFGAHRLTALDLNIAYFLTYLVVTAELVRRRLGIAAALVALALICVARTVTLPAGGAFDFRFDFIAFSLWGTLLGLIALALPSRGVRPWLAVLFVGVWLILSRLIAATYAAPVLAGLFGLTFVGLAGRRPSPPLVRRWLLLIGSAWGAVLALVVGRNWVLIESYYVRGHLAGAEKGLRALDQGVITVGDSLLYYVTSTVRDHAGREPLLLAAIAIVGAAGVAAFERRRGVCVPRWAERRESGSGLRWPLATSALGLLIPYVVLTANESKSPVTANVLVPPLVLLAAIGVASLTWQASGARRSAAVALCAAILVGGIVLQVDRVSRPQYAPAARADLEAASRMAIDIGDYLARGQFAKPRWGTDTIMDALASGTAEVFYYEQRGVWLGIQPGMGHAPIDFSYTVDELLDQAASGDVLVLTSPGAGGPARYPLEQSLQAARPRLRELAERELIPLGQYRMFGRDVTVFVRPSVRVERLAGDGWVLRDGIDVVVAPEAAQRGSTVVLRGQSDFTRLPAPPAVTASIADRGTPRETVPARLDISGAQYELRVEVPAGRGGPGQPLKIQLSFSTSFAPSRVTNSPDSRELVMLGPTERRVVLSPQVQ